MTESWDDLLRYWRNAVNNVDCGVIDTGIEYVDVLELRDQIERVLGFVPTDVRALVEPGLLLVDADFLAVTRRANQPVGIGSGKWWWFRIPERMDPDLASEMRDVGIDYL